MGNGKEGVLISDKEEHTGGTEGPADIRKYVLMVAPFALFSELLPPL